MIIMMMMNSYDDDDSKLWFLILQASTYNVRSSEEISRVSRN